MTANGQLCVCAQIEEENEEDGIYHPLRAAIRLVENNWNV